MGRAPWSVVAWWTFEVRFAEGHELASDLYATFRVGVDDHAQRTVEVVALIRSQVVHLLGREGCVGGQEGIPVALEFRDTLCSSLKLL